MKQARLNPLWIYSAVGAVIIALVALAGCTFVGESLTGVSVDGAGPTTCIKQCNDFFAGEYNKEQKLHDTNVENCQALSQPAKGDCLVAETARHEAAKAALTAAKIGCQNNCHRQGTGSAG